MTQEEKAKRYDDALERAKKLYEQGTITESLNYVFPELAESDDERIRKELLESFKYQQRESRTDKEWLNGIKLSEVVAWLEKQGEQKPKWTDEDERGSDETIELLEYFINYAPEFRKPAIGRSIAWLKSLKQRMGV